VVMGVHDMSVGYDSHGEQWKFAEEVTKATKPTERVVLHYPSMSARKELWYYLDRSLDEITSLPQANKYRTDAVLVYDDRGISPPERAYAESLMRQHPTRFYDHFVMIDLRQPTARIEGWAFEKGPMSLTYKLFVSHVYAPLTPVREANPLEVCTALRLNVPLAKDERLPARGSGSCWGEYLQRRNATPGDTIPPR